MPEVLKLNGYSTAQFGKCHEVPVWQTSPMGPFDMWPTGSGFEYFYGFIGGEDNQWNPALYEGTTPIEPEKTPEEGYHLTEDLADKAIAWVRRQKAVMPDKPFFMYFSLGATHAPHHVPPEWIEKYAGRFDDGWDRLREETFARQKELGVIAADAELTARHAEIPAWDDMPEATKPVLARQMEVYAAFLEHTDHHVGRLVDAIDGLGALEETLVYVIVGDNGASAEGTMNGAFNEMANFNAMAELETPEFMASMLDKFGSPESYNHCSVGWAHAMNTPYQWDQAGRVALGRHAERHDRALAEGHHRQGREPASVLPHHRRRPDGPGGRRPSPPDDGQRGHTGADRGDLDGLQLRRAARAGTSRPAVL
jgi:arylsulfatase A-like enzyme